MKKRFLLLVICLFILPLCAYAEDNSLDNDSLNKDFAFSEDFLRKFEIGFLNINFAFSNDFLSLQDVFQETIVLDIDNLSKGFRVNLGIGITPIYFNVFMGEWGFGLSTGVEAAGLLSLSGKLLTFSNAVNEKSDVSGALFASAGLNGFFNIDKFKVTVKPVLFYTIAYLKPNISYTFDPDSGNILKLDYDMLLYTAFPVDSSGSPSGSGLSAAPGIDFSFGVEYALSKEFDVGLNLINIPVAPSVMNDYLQFKGLIGSDDPIDPLNGGINDLLSSFDDFDSDPIPGTGSLEVERPFRLAAWVNWRVFGTPFLTLTPSVGFSINRLYSDEFSMEFGVNARLNLVNLIFISAGTRYEDRLWINGVDLVINMKIFEFNVGADIRSQDFIKSWTGGGIGLNMGFKFGW
jgi:hypothetical protein